MAKMIDGDIYLSPQEASAILHVSYKTLQRWVEAGTRNIWVQTNGHRTKQRQNVNIEVRYTPTGYRLYLRESIERLRQMVQDRPHQDMVDQPRQDGDDPTHSEVRDVATAA